MRHSYLIKAFELGVSCREYLYQNIGESCSQQAIRELMSRFTEICCDVNPENAALIYIEKSIYKNIYMMSCREAISHMITYINLFISELVTSLTIY